VAALRVLTVNAGSSSLKLRLLGPADELLGDEELEADGGHADASALAAALERLGEADAVAHRFVHGGTAITGPRRIDDGVLATLRELTDLAPLHQPAALAAQAEVTRLRPGLPAVACVDTAFHATLPAAASTYALPRDWGVRRFGFHGLSHAYAARRATELAGARRVVSCHLGAGASLAAVDGGRSVDTTMGFTPVDGLVMATRPGSVDPGALLWLLERGGHRVAEVSDVLEHGGGLKALAGTADMRAVLARTNADALLARDVYLHRLRALIAAMVAALGGLDALVFTGGVGERASEIRRGAAAGLGFLGVAVDAALDADATPDADVSAPGAAVRTLVIAAREDLTMSREARAVL
jgi:acetate kinase